MLIELAAEPPVYVQVMGKLFRVLAIGTDDAKVNEYLTRVDHGAVIWSERDRFGEDRVYIADKRDKGK